jgi:hypothetical protein
MLPTGSPPNAGAEIERQSRATGGQRVLNGCHGEAMVREPLASLQKSRGKARPRTTQRISPSRVPQIAGWRVVIRSVRSLRCRDLCPRCRSTSDGAPRWPAKSCQAASTTRIFVASQTSITMETGRHHDFARQPQANSAVAFCAAAQKAPEGIGRRERHRRPPHTAARDIAILVSICTRTHQCLQVQMAKPLPLAGRSLRPRDKTVTSRILSTIRTSITRGLGSRRSPDAPSRPIRVEGSDYSTISWSIKILSLANFATAVSYRSLGTTSEKQLWAFAVQQICGQLRAASLKYRQRFVKRSRNLTSCTRE